MKWDYLTVPITATDGFETDEQLKIHGRAGWELVCITPHSGHAYPRAFFKRPAEDKE